MRIAKFLLDLGGGIFVLLGLLHALYTFLDIGRPRRLVPQDPSVARAMAESQLRLARGGTTMWRAWVGFNFRHSLGVALFGGLCLLASGVLGTMAVPGGMLGLFVAIAFVCLGLIFLSLFVLP